MVTKNTSFCFANAPCGRACRRVAKATGAQMVLTLADMDGNETFDASALGSAEEVLLSLIAFSLAQ